MGKTMSSLILIPIIVVLLIVEKFTIPCLAIKNNVTFDCFPREKNALLRFKASFSDDPSNNMLSSWRTNSDCCAWMGVECDNGATGHVVGLHLGYINSSPYSMIRSDAVDSSLLELKYLSYLDLSRNDFRSSHIPSFLGLMKQLQYLNLSDAGFAGTIPHRLGNLSSLRTLDLGGGDYLYGNSLIVDDLSWASNLSSLEYLDMSNVNLSATKDLVKVLDMLPSLVELRLSTCGLDNTNLALITSCANSTRFTNNIQHLDLSGNSFGENSSFCFLHNMTSLRFLDLSRNNLFGPIPLALGNLRVLEELYLNGNNMSGPIPSTLENLRALRVLNLYRNNFSGSIPSTLENLRALRVLVLSRNNFSGPIPSTLENLRALTVLDISGNNFSSSIPSTLGNLRALRELNLGENNLSGSIPFTLGNLSDLKVLDLSINQLSGEIPISLGQLSNLESICMDSNSFEGTLSEAHFDKLSKLEDIYIGFNYGLKLRVGYDWVPPFHQLETLYVEYVEIGGQFPQWLQTQESLTYLSLLNCSITGMLPKWIGSFVDMTYLYLSNNHIMGPIPDLPSSLEFLFLDENFINGSIPDSVCQMKALDSFDLSNNHLSGNLPHCLGNLDSLRYAKLSSNRISGLIPNSVGRAYRLRWLMLNNNSLTGGIPSSLRNCTRLLVLDIGDNKLNGELPEWIGNHLLNLVVLRLRNNSLYGDIPFSYCNLSGLRILDVAQNQLTGNIPNCFGNLSAMVKDANIEGGHLWSNASFNEMMKGVMLEYTTTSLYLVNLDLSSNRLSGEITSSLTRLTGLNGFNLSHNHLGGTIPRRIGDMISLESFDLSSNNLHGTIPQSLSKLTSLSFLNLSNNDLSGPIPTGTQLQTFNNPSSYEGNPGLCGAPLMKKCQPYKTLPKVKNDDDRDMINGKIYLYASIITGVATGFWGYFGVLIFKRSWRLALFRYMDTIISKMLGRY